MLGHLQGSSNVVHVSARLQCFGAAYHILQQVGNAKGAQAAKGQATHGWVLVPAVLVQLVDGQEGQVRSGGCVMRDV